MTSATILRASALAIALVVTPLSAPSWWRQFDPWSSGTVVMQLQLGSSGGTLIDGSADWGESAERSLVSWNANIKNLQLAVIRNSSAPIASSNAYNNVFFSTTVYGKNFNDYASPTQPGGIAAVSLYWSTNGVRTESDVIFNSALPWNSYRGPGRQTSSGAFLTEFARTALHEFGHTLGLTHPNDFGQTVPAIMNSTFSDHIDTLTADDVAGAQSYYGAVTLTAPGAPSVLTATSSGSSLTLSWYAPTTGGVPSAYTVEAGSSSGAANLANFSTGGATTTYSGARFSTGTFYVRVRAANVAGTSAPSNEALLTGSATPPAPAAPGAPIGVTATASGSSVTLSWTAPTSGGAPSAYRIEAGSSAGLANLANFSTGNTSTTFSAGGIAAGTYYVRVRASNSVGTSAVSNEAQLIVGGGCSGAPGAPSGLSLVLNSGGVVSLAWSASTGTPTTYIVEGGSAPGLANLATIDLGGTSTSFSAGGVPSGTYYVRIRARNACGISLVSNEIVLTV